MQRESFPSEMGLGGHMSHHRCTDQQPRCAPSPSDSAIDEDGALLDSSADEPSSPSPETQCRVCSKLFPSCNSLLERMRMHAEKKSMSEENTARQVQALDNDDGDRKVTVSAPVKPKRSALEVTAAEEERPRTSSSNEEIRCGDISVDVKGNNHQCNVCSEVFESGQALEGHKRYHYATSCGRCEQQKQRLDVDSEVLDLITTVPNDGEHVCAGVESKPPCQEAKKKRGVDFEMLGIKLRDLINGEYKARYPCLESRVPAKLPSVGTIGDGRRSKKAADERFSGWLPW